MKLYTEEQVNQILNRAGATVTGSRKQMSEYLMKDLTPIELPTDEEIVFKSNFYYPTKKIAGYMSEEDFVQYAKKESFEDGAKWMKEQILKQNK